MVFIKDKMHLEDCPSGRISKTLAIKVDIFLQLDMEELEATINVSKPDEKPNIKEEAKEYILVTKST